MDYNVPQLTPRQVATLPYNGGMNAKFIAGGAGILASRLRGAPAPRVLVSAPRRNPFRIPRSTFRFPLSAFRFPLSAFKVFLVLVLDFLLKT